MDIVGFAVSTDSKVPDSIASHGVCLPARVLRSVTLVMGFFLPCWNEWRS